MAHHPGAEVLIWGPVLDLEHLLRPGLTPTLLVQAEEGDLQLHRWMGVGVGKQSGWENHNAQVLH